MSSKKMYSEEQLIQMDNKADNTITTMTISAVGIGFAPVMIDVAALMVAMGVGVVAVGKCYNINLTKEDAGDLIRQFFRAAGITYSMVFAGQKIATSVLKSNPVSYFPTMIADAIMCGSIAFAVGNTSKRYFRKLADGKKASAAEIKKWMNDGKETGKKVAKTYAEEKAKEKNKE